ncbi:MAG TPA: RNA polymerase factor sigma-32 [Polyangiaceae bacterium]|nr:RNA polymerase factor sigma-32 [Polyangiaceae bacterium]
MAAKKSSPPKKPRADQTATRKKQPTGSRSTTSRTAGTPSTDASASTPGGRGAGARRGSATQARGDREADDALDGESEIVTTGEGQDDLDDDELAADRQGADRQGANEDSTFGHADDDDGDEDANDHYGSEGRDHEDSSYDDYEGDARRGDSDEGEPEGDEDQEGAGRGRFARPSRALVPSQRGSSLGRSDPLEVYMREIQQHRLLTPDEEHELAVRYAKEQDVDAAARLVTANLRLVVKLAYEYRRAYRNMMDLIQEGNMGLMQAVKKYDPYRGVKLSSYAAWWIRAYMLRFILNNWRMVKLGTTQAQRKLFFNLNKERARLSALGIEPSNAEIASRLEVTESEVEEMDKRLSRGDASLDTPVNETDGRQTARVELMPASTSTPDSLNEGAELSHLVRKNLDEFRATLSGKDLLIFDQRLVADEPRTLQDLGDQFGVSRERVRQLEARLTGKLRTFLAERLGDAVEVA